jgi:hypothetical protein
MTPENVELTDSVAEAVSRINAEFWDADDLEMLTGTKSSTWRYWSHIGWGPPSFRLGKRRLWRRSVVEAWLAEQERAGAEQQRERTALAADDEPAAERLLTRTGPAQPRFGTGHTAQDGLTSWQGQRRADVLAGTGGPQPQIAS